MTAHLHALKLNWYLLLGGMAIITQVLIEASCGAGYRMQLIAHFALAKVALEQDPTKCYYKMADQEMQ